MATKSFLQKIDLRAAIIFIAAHFVSVGLYDLLVVDNEFVVAKGGFVLHMLQAYVFILVTSFSMSRELKITSLIIAVIYALMAINWSVLERGIESNVQAHFYGIFASIIITMNLIVIFLLGKDGALHIFNRLYMSLTFRGRIQLFFRDVHSNSVCDIDLPIGDSDFKSKEGCQ